MNEKRCPCGGVIYADTEDWDIPICYKCYVKSNKGRNAINFELQKPKVFEYGTLSRVVRKNVL